MPNSTTTALHLALGETGAEIDYPLVERAVAARLPESARLEWKRELPKKLGDLISDIVAMANSEGGVLIVGVDEDDDGLAGSIHPVAVNDDERLRLRSAIAGLSQPPLGGVDIIGLPAPDSSSGVIAIVVERSSDRPHFSGSESRMGVPLRNGAGTRWMREYEIANEYARRFTTVERLRERLLDSEAYVGQFLNPATAWATATMTPAEPAGLVNVIEPREVPATVKAAIAIANSMTIEHEYSTTLVNLNDDRDSSKPGLRRRILHDNWSNDPNQLSNNIRVELHDDGSITLAESLHADAPQDQKQGNHVVSELAIARFARGVVALAAAHTRQQGVDGRVHLRVNLVQLSDPRNRLELWGPELRLSGRWGDERPRRGARTVHLFLPIELTFDTRDDDGLVDTAKAVARDVLSQFGQVRYLGFMGEKTANGSIH